MWAFLLIAVVQAQTNGYTLYCTGACTRKVTTIPTPGVLLAGGSTDQADAMTWLVNRANGGDFLVLRASGADGYNTWLMGLGRLNSVTTIVCTQPRCATDVNVLRIIDESEAIFFAGGDQSVYINYWANTPVQTRVQAAVRSRNVPIGGTSAGCAIIGEFVYDAQAGGATSAIVLRNPYDRTVTISGEFIEAVPPYLKSVITDQHFSQRDRLGRLLVFMARIIQDGRHTSPRGVAVDEATCLAIETSGRAVVFGANSVFIITSSQPPAVCRANTPLTYQGLTSRRLTRGQQFDFRTMIGGTPSSLRVVDGVVFQNDIAMENFTAFTESEESF